MSCKAKFQTLIPSTPAVTRLLYVPPDTCQQIGLTLIVAVPICHGTRHEASLESSVRLEMTPCTHHSGKRIICFLCQQKSRPGCTSPLSRVAESNNFKRLLHGAVCRFSYQQAMRPPFWIWCQPHDSRGLMHVRSHRQSGSLMLLHLH